MNRLNNYLENLDRKNKVMLYLSVVILCFIVGYFIYENILIPKENLFFSKKIGLIKKIRKIHSNNNMVKKVKKIYKIKKMKLVSSKEDLRYLKALIGSSQKLYVDKKEYLKITDGYLKEGSNLNASFEFNQTDGLDKYNIDISGCFKPYKYFYFVNFLKTLQAPKAIITVNNMDLNYTKNVNYKIDLSVWSLK